MKKIKLTGRETAVLKAIDFSSGSSGTDIQENSRMATDDLVDVLNGLLEVGYIECTPYHDKVTNDSFSTLLFEVNPAYVHDLRDAMIKRY